MKLLLTKLTVTNANTAKSLDSNGIPVEKKPDGKYLLPQEVTFDPSILTYRSTLPVSVYCDCCKKERIIPYLKYVYAPQKDCPQCISDQYKETAQQVAPTSTTSNLVSKTVKITLASPKDCSKWEKLGYVIPKEKYDRGRNNAGKTLGFRYRFVLGSEIEVNISDLSPSSHARVTYKCVKCNSHNTTEYIQYLKRTTDLCPTCNKSHMGRANSVLTRDRKENNSYGKEYWKKKLIHENPNAKCDITGETDKRFLIVHHLIPRNLGGQEIEENVVVITSNMHQAFHSQYGHNVGIKEYEEFKHAERLRLNIG